MTALPQRATPAALEELAALMGERFSVSDAVREQHSHDESWHEPEAPQAVVFPESTQEVAEIVKICAAHGTPVIAFGTGTSLEGHVVAVEGGITVNMTVVMDMCGLGCTC